MVRYGVVWCGGMVWRGVAWCGMVWFGVVWFGVVWCGVVWCGANIFGLSCVQWKYLHIYSNMCECTSELYL